MMRLIVILWILPHCMCITTASEVDILTPLFPALFVFGDSLMDAGNNNYLQTALAKANSLPNGVDFPTHNATGRFCNGKTVIDLIADYVGLNYTPPYLAPTTHGAQILQGVNYASGAGGILDETGAIFSGRLSLSVQLSYYKNTIAELTALLGTETTAKLLAEALVVVNLGANDYMYNYLLPNSSLQAEYNPQQFHTFLASQLKMHLRMMYTVGARKFIVNSVGPFGCIPSRIAFGASNGTCVTSDNEMAMGFNSEVQAMLPQLSSSLTGAIFCMAIHTPPFWTSYKTQPSEILRSPTGAAVHSGDSRASCLVVFKRYYALFVRKSELVYILGRLPPYGGCERHPEPGAVLRLYLLRCSHKFA